MAVVVRGWSKTASTAVKLATAERIIGYQFKHVDRLYEALDQTGRRVALPSGATLRPKKRNSRLALVGDALAKLQMTQDWYARAHLSGAEFSEIEASTLSNERLGAIGFRLGLDECAISREIVRRYDMATTIEALIAAVHMDGASKHQVRKVCVRFGLEHKLLDPAERLWIWEMVKSKLSLPDRFFIGHHLKLQVGIFETQLKRLPALEKQNVGLWGRAKLWWRTKTLWEPHKKIELLGKDSGGHHEDVEKAVASEKTTDAEDSAERHEIAESSPSKATQRQTQPVHLQEHMSADDVQPAEIGSQDSNIASNDDAANGVEKQVAHPAGQSSEVDYAEATKKDDSKERREQRAEEMKQEAAKIREAILEIRKAHKGDEMTQEDKMKIKELYQQHQRIIDRRSMVLNHNHLHPVEDTVIDRS